MITPDELKQLIADAENGKPELKPEIVNMAGYSAPKVRRLLNALCSREGARYLEIGVNAGSTLIPALYGNTARATAIDNWSLSKDARNGLNLNLKQLLPRRRINFIESDCFQIDPAKIAAGVNVYFYDGDHGRKAQYDAVARFAPVMADQFVLLVDDCNWEEPREETKHALKDLGYTVLYDVLLPGKYNGDQAGWWNGLYVGLIRK